jgi:hypothetical protein
LFPANGELGSATPTLTWTANPQAARYLIEIFQMPSHNLVLYDTNVPSASYTVGTALGEATYEWHVGGYDSAGHNVGENSLTPTFVVPLQFNFPSIAAAEPSQATTGPGAVDGGSRSLKNVTEKPGR